MSFTKVIFLDFDGVLNSEKYVRSCGHYGVVIDPSRMVLLKQIIDAIEAEIVLTTSWREHWDADSEKCDAVGREINGIFREYGLRIFDKTPSFNRCRESEIELWLQFNPSIQKFVVLDDRFLDSEILRCHFVKTSNYLDGIDEQNVREAIEILNY